MSSPSEAISQTDSVERAGKNIVVQDLARFGPESKLSKIELGEARQYCKSLAKRHYENFSVASLLVPRAIRQDFYNIYAYCRWSDDLADEMGSTIASIQLLDWWRSELRACFSGNATHPVFVALKDTISTHGLSMEPFEHLLDAFLQDQKIHRYQSQPEILEYCRGSANPVGRILLQLAKIKQPTAIQLSDRVCSGLQIANFCQDIRADAIRGRIYLPRDLWNRFQIEEAEILDGKASDKLRYALKAWGDLARTFLVSGLPLVQLTPRWLSRDIQLFVRGGITILDNIARANFNVWDHPIEVTKAQKLCLLARAIALPRSLHVADPTRSRISK